MSDTWKQEGDHFTRGEMSAERDADDHAFVITSFGSQPDADQVFAAIQAATAFGMIRLRVTPETRPIIETLTGDGRIKCVRTVGAAQAEVGVMGIKRA